MRYVYETKVAFSNATEAIELAIADLKFYSRSTHKKNCQHYLDFTTATAIIRGETDGLLVRVASDEAIDCQGAQSLIISEINKHAIGMPLNVLWTTAMDEPFAAILSRS